jgi:hypothetical protein
VAQSDHFVENAAEGPDVRLLIVWLLLTDLRRQIVRSTDSSLCAIVSVLEYSSNTEVTNLDLAVLRHEDVLSFQVSVQDLPVMNVFDCKRHLHEPVQNLVFRVTHYSLQS